VEQGQTILGTANSSMSTLCQDPHVNEYPNRTRAPDWKLTLLTTRPSSAAASQPAREQFKANCRPAGAGYWENRQCPGLGTHRCRRTRARQVASFALAALFGGKPATSLTGLFPLNSDSGSESGTKCISCASLGCGQLRVRGSGDDCPPTLLLRLNAYPGDGRCGPCKT